MKHALLISAILFIFSLHAQEIPTAPKAKHSFYLGGGGFAESEGNWNYSGWSSVIGYQIYFPNRFIFGIEYLMEQSAFGDSYESGENFTSWRRMKTQSGRIHIGIHIARKKHFDFSIMLVPNINYQEYIIKEYDKEKDEYAIYKRHTTYLFVPLLAYRFEFFYKFNQQHAIGLTADLEADMEWDGFGDLFSADFLALGRAMLYYRFTIPRR